MLSFRPALVQAQRRVFRGAAILCGLVAAHAAQAQSVSAALTTTTTALSAGGGTVALTATFDFPGKTLSALGWTMQLPTGWSYVGSSGNDVPNVAPRAGDTEQLNWAYIDPSGLPGTAQFTTTLRYAAGLVGTQTIQAVANYRVSGNSTALTATPPNVTFTVAPTVTAIASQPASKTAAPGSAVSFSVAATGSGTLSYQWRKNGVVLAGATASILTISSVQASDAGNYDVIVTGGGGSATSTVATLTVTAASAAPAISAQPASVSAIAGAAAAFTVAATGQPTPTYQWRKNGVAISGATSATLTFTSVQTGDAGSYDVVVTNSAGNVVSAAATLTVTPTPPATSAPVITTQPVSQSVASGAAMSFSVTASGNPTPTYQWRKNGATIAGATGAALLLSSVQPADAGNYEVVVTNSAGTATSSAATLTVLVSRLVNASVRSAAGTGDQTLIVGFVLGGAGPKQMLIRGVGPTLAQFGVTGALADPRLRLFNGTGVLITENDDWSGSPALTAAFAQTGAFALAPNSKDAALLIPLATGSYAAHITSAVGSGIALVEAYDADGDTSTTRMVNLSVRTQVGTGENVLVVGFVIAGNVARNLLVRGVGPTLGQFGVSGTLPDPQLRLFDGSRQIQENDNWGGTAGLASAFSQAGAFPLAADSKDAALAVTLAPGAYSVQVSGVGDATGVVLVELYELP